VLSGGTPASVFRRVGSPSLNRASALKDQDLTLRRENQLFLASCLFPRCKYLATTVFKFHNSAGLEGLLSASLGLRGT
jgi:hypothetical protein